MAALDFPQNPGNQSPANYFTSAAGITYYWNGSEWTAYGSPGFVAMSGTAGAQMSGRIKLSGDPINSLDAATKQYVDNATSGAGTFSNLTLTGELRGPASFIIDPAAIGDNTGTVTIKGNLQVDGDTTTINSETLTVDDKNIVLASGATNSAAADAAGITVNGANASLVYTASGDKWVLNKVPYYNTNRLLTTADEGSGNGLDADTLDGQHASSFSASTHNHNTAYLALSGGTLSGDIWFSGGQTVDGYDVSVLGAKVATIDANADVTNATNVAGAGAVMESDTTTAAMQFVLDQDNLSSNSATKLATQQSIKAYVDAHTGTTNLTAYGDGTTVYVTSDTGTNAQITGATSLVGGIMTSAMFNKLDGIESGATADQTNAEIRAAVAAASDSNVFTNSYKTKLDGIASGAEVNVQSDWNATTGDSFIQNKPTLNFLPLAGGTLTGDLDINAKVDISNDSTSPAIDTIGPSSNTSYNYIIRGRNDGGNRAVHFVNNTNRTTDGGANTYTIRNDGGKLVLGRSNQHTVLEGTTLKHGTNVILTAANYTTYAASAAHDHDAVYYKKIGGTLTGNLQINSNAPTIELIDTGASGARFWYQNDNGQLTIRTNYGSGTGWSGDIPLVLTNSSKEGNLYGNRLLTTADEGSGNGLDADTLDGYQSSSSNTANTIALRNSAGDIYARLFRSTYGNQSTISGAMAYRVNTTDNYIRFCSDTSAIKTWLGLGSSVAGQKVPSYFTVTRSGDWGVLELEDSNGNQRVHLYSSMAADYAGIGVFDTNGANRSDLVLNRGGNMTWRGSTVWDASNDGRFLRSDVNDVIGGVLSYHSNDARLQFRNTSYDKYLYIGGWSSANSAGISRIRNSNANLHLDSGSDGNCYLNWYASNRTIYLGNTGQTVRAAGNNLVWHQGNDGSGSGLDADTVDGIQGASLIRSDVNDNVSADTEWQDNCEIRLGNDADFRMWWDGNHAYFRNYKHPNGNIYFQGENTAGTNHALIYMYTDVERTYVKLYENSGERLRTTSLGINVVGELNVTRNGGVTGTSVPTYSQVNIEVQTSSNHVPGIGFHRGGHSATTLYEYDGQLYTNAWVSRAQTGLLLSTGNISTYALRSDGTNQGAASIRVDDADFTVWDNSDTVKNYIWRDHSASKLYLGTSAAVITARSHIMPGTDSTYNLGSSSVRFSNVYGDNIYGQNNFYMTPSSSTASCRLEIGSGRTGTGYAYMDLIGDATYTDYGLRVMRGNGGANGWSGIYHRGTGNFYIITNDSANIYFRTQNTDRMALTSGGYLGVGTTSPTKRLSVNGDADVSGSISVGDEITTSSYVYADTVRLVAGNSYSRIRFWNSSSYGIGMYNDQTFGAVNDYCMTFQMSNNSTRGWVWRHTGHSAAQGAMSLDIQGRCTIANALTVGCGESYTSAPAKDIHVYSNVATIRIQDSGHTNTYTDLYHDDDDFHLMARDGSSYPNIYIRQYNGTTNRPVVRWTTGGNFFPGANNAFNMGNNNTRWKRLFAVTATSVSSDRDLKQDIEELNEKEKKVAVALKGLIRKYRLISQVQETGDKAKVHIGVIAQDVGAAFEAEGLDPNKYELYENEMVYEDADGNECSQEDAVTSTRCLGIIYTELLAFIISAL